MWTARERRSLGRLHTTRQLIVFGMASGSPSLLVLLLAPRLVGRLFSLGVACGFRLVSFDVLSCFHSARSLG